MPSPPHPRRALDAARLLAFVVVAGLALLGLQRTVTEGARTPALRAADALPVYLAAAATLDGEDPTTQEGLQRAYERREMKVRAATFSNLYPATTGVLLAPLATGTWERFVTLWRWLLLLGGVVAGGAAGLASVRGPNAPLGAAIGVWLAVTAFPVTAECVALGQANLLVGGTLALAMLGLSRGWRGATAAAVVLGGGIKLVPGVVAWTLLAGRRWRALAWVVGLGLVLLVPTLRAVPLDRFVSGIQGTLQFQGAISPGWIVSPETPPWLSLIGDLRHTPAMLVTLAFMGSAAWVGGRAPPPQRQAVLAGTVAVATAWLGADAAGFHILYAPLYIPAVAWVATWPLDASAPRWALPAALVGAAPALLLGWDLPGVPAEARLVLAGLLVWGVALARLWSLAPPLPVPGLGLVGVAAGWGVAAALALGDGPRGPDPATVPMGDVTGLGLPEGVGHGGPQPGAGVPLPDATLPDGLDPAQLALPAAPRVAGTGSSGVRMEEVLEPAQAARLTSHLVQAPRAWAKLDHPLAAWLAAEAPRPPAALVAYGPLARWMAWEEVGMERIEGTEAIADEYRRTWARMGLARP